MIALGIIVFFGSIGFLVRHIRRRNQKKNQMKTTTYNAQMQPIPQIPVIPNVQAQGQAAVYQIPPSSMVQTVIYPAPSGRSNRNKFFILSAIK